VHQIRPQRSDLGPSLHLVADEVLLRKEPDEEEDEDENEGSRKEDEDDDEDDGDDGYSE
jgi:hypothetical protein